MGLPVVVGTVEEVDTPNVDEVLEQIKHAVTKLCICSP